MNKGKSFSAVIMLLIVLASTSCKRKHECICYYTGSTNAFLQREYRGYSRAEARKLCKSEEHGANAHLLIDCDIR